MARKYLALDIESATGWPDGADWKPYRPLGISCAATLSADAETPTLWHGLNADQTPADRMDRRDVARLVEHLLAMVDDGYTILTFNGQGFDFQVVAEESAMGEQCKRIARDHVDMMFHVFCELGHPVGLAAAAKAMKLSGKPEGMSGLLAPEMWAQGKRREILDYVAQDARTTLDLAMLCEREACFKWVTRKGAVRRMPLPGGWLTVSQALKLPEPDTSWMPRPMTRRKFIDWLQS